MTPSRGLEVDFQCQGADTPIGWVQRLSRGKTNANSIGIVKFVELVKLDRNNSFPIQGILCARGVQPLTSLA